MSFSIEHEAGQRIITGAPGDDFDINREIYAYINTLKDTLDGMDGPVICITDIQNFEFNFGDLTSVLGTLTRSDLAVMKHPNLLKTIVVTRSSMIRLSVNALGQKQYGAFRIAVAGTLDEAREQATRELAVIRQ